MKVREALDRIFIRFSVDGLGRHWIRLNEHDWQLIRSALSSPPRNCDVGTANEQAERFKEFCFDHQAPWHGCTNCPVLMSEQCAITWAQMPYVEEGGGDGNK